MPHNPGVVESQSLSEVLAELGSGELVAESFGAIARAAFSSEKQRYELDTIRNTWKKAASSVSAANSAALEGYCHFLASDLDKAAAVLDKDKKNPWAVYYLTRVLVAQQQTEKALSTVEAAMKKFRDFRPLAFLAVDVYCKNGWEDQVPAILKALDSEFRDTSELAFYNGLYRERVGEHQEAIERYREAVRVDPENTQAWFRLGFCLDLYGRGDEETLDEAISAYENCLNVVPPHTNAVINLGTLYEDRERYHDAIKCYETVLHYYPNHHRARLFLEDARASTRMFYDRDEEKKADRQSQVLRIPVSDFELSVRSRNCLQKMNISTLGDLIMKTEQELLSYKNFGETSLKEIKDMLASKGLRLGQGLEQSTGDVSQSRNPLEATAEPELLAKPIEELNLSVRSRRCMERLGVKSLRDLINKTEVQLMSAKNFGMTSLNEIKRKLAEYGLRLRG